MHTMIFKRTILFFAFSEAKNPPPKSEHLKSVYKDSYIALELVNGTGNLLLQAMFIVWHFL